MSDEKDDKWEMPQPVFRSTEGAAPKSLEDTISTSFMPNAETLEIDEDDDILGIMETRAEDQPAQHTDNFDSEPILETGSVTNGYASEASGYVSDVLPVSEAAPEYGVPAPVGDEVITSDSAGQPMTDTAAAAAAPATIAAKPKEIDGRRADHLTYLFMAIAGGALLLLSIFYWIWPPANVR